MEIEKWINKTGTERYDSRLGMTTLRFCYLLNEVFEKLPCYLTFFFMMTKERSDR